ncbi:effector-associated constant component EACC1 [Nocardia australiensis]|uniref:effector-associated constant component EACC1 n=1 Tax=Nocardia australiensis TaxID=2887191 RepID=UPI001D157168|nr:hypothetical protein [Nocardia australiensis]
MRQNVTISNANSEWTIRADGSPDELLELLDWFGHDDALRGHVRPVPARIGAGQMGGGPYEVLAVALGAGGLVSALTQSLTTWLTHRRSDIKLTLTRGDGTAVMIDASRVKSPEVLRELRDLLDPPENGL